MLVSASCGPVEYISQVSQRAGRALAEARHENAEQLAIYEFTAAQEYFDKAQEEAGHSAYEVAIAYGHRAEAWATKASTLARKNAAATAKPAPKPSGRP
jgi:hypothetical protein